MGEKLLELTTKLQEVIEAAGPVVWAAAVRQAMITGWLGVGIGAILLLIAAMLCLVARAYWGHSEAATASLMGVALSAGGGFGLICHYAPCLLNPEWQAIQYIKGLI